MRGIGLLTSIAILALAIGGPAPRAQAASPTVFNLASRVPVLSRPAGGNLGATPLDGTLTVRLTRSAALVLIGDDGQAMRPTGRRGMTLTYRVCGERSVAIRVTAPDIGRRVDLEVGDSVSSGTTRAHWNPRARR